jgi:hypothetical protein
VKAERKGKQRGQEPFLAKKRTKLGVRETCYDAFTPLALRNPPSNRPPAAVAVRKRLLTPLFGS